MLCDDIPGHPNVSITSSATADSERFQVDHHDSILTITMNVRRSMIVGVYHDIEAVLSQNCWHRVTLIQIKSIPNRESDGRPCDDALTPNRMSTLDFESVRQRNR